MKKCNFFKILCVALFLGVVFSSTLFLQENQTVKASNYCFENNLSVEESEINSTLQNPTNVIISAENWQTTAKEFVININFSHEFKNVNSFSFDVKWYRNGSYLKQTSTYSITERITNASKYTYQAKIMISYEGESTQYVDSNIIDVYVVEPIEPISGITYNGKGNVTWRDNSKTVNLLNEIYYAQYSVTLYKKGSLKDTKVKTLQINSQESDLNANFFDQFTQVNSYKIGVVKKIGNLFAQEIYSNYFDIALVKYNCDTTEVSIQKEFIDVNSRIATPQAITKTGYTFKGWFKDSNFEEKISFPYKVTVAEEITFFAKWELNPLKCKIEGNLNNLVYDENEHKIVIGASHELSNLTFKFEWFKLVNENYEKLTNLKNNEIFVQNVEDNGDYYCKVTASDSSNRTTEKDVYFIVNMQKANTEIIVQEITKKYKYDKTKQTVPINASLTRSNEVVSLEITGNEFENVPEGGLLQIKVFAPETKNYKSAEKIVKVPISKAETTLFIEDQVFVYNGQKAIPNGTVLNDEQNGLMYFDGEDIINVGPYKRKVIVPETMNYKAYYKEVKIEIVPAIIQIKAKDTTSFWLFGKKDFDYEIVEGELFGDDVLKVNYFCNVDISKPGNYVISLTATNSNYYVGVIDGNYKVSIVPYVVVLLLIILIVSYVFIKKRMKPYVVEFEGDGVVISPITVKNKNDIKISIPSRKGFVFNGWYLDINYTKKFNGKFKRGTTVTLYSKWQQIENDQETIINENEIAKSFVNNLFNKTESILNEEVVVEEKTEPEVLIETKQESSEMDLIRDILQKVESEKSQDSQINSEELNNLINQLTNKK